MSNKEGKEVKEGSKETVLDIKQITDYLNHAMRQASQGLKATRSKDGVKSPLYELQVEFCYMMYEITSGPLYIVPKVVTECNELIAKVTALKAAPAAEA